jgi:hypothetical protein
MVIINMVRQYGNNKYGKAIWYGKENMVVKYGS